MIVSRCAWHPEYWQSPALIGITWEWRLRVAFSDGMCGPCSVMFRAINGLPQRSERLRVVKRA